MIALAVISIGGLGYVTSQVGSLKNISITMTRTLATLLIYDMTARMQANSAEFWMGSSSGYLSTAVANPNCYYNSTGAICTSTQMAQNDLSEWQSLVTTSFPAAMQAVGLVCLDGGAATVPTGSPACGAINASYPLTFSLKIYWKSVPGAATYDQVQVSSVEAPTLRASTYPLASPIPNQ